MTDQSKDKGKSLFKRGADDGFWMGLFLSVLFVAMAYSVYSALVGVLALAMLIAVPFLIFFFLRRSYRYDNCRTQFSGLWLHGICIFFFGSLLMALTSYIYLRFADPTYLNSLVNMAKEVYQSVDSPEAQQMAAVLQKAQDSHLIPTPGQLAMEIIWLGVFSGSLLSMIVSAIVRATSRPTPPPPPADLRQL